MENKYLQPTNFANIMKECLIAIMNRIPEDVPRDKAFFDAQVQVVKIRQKCEVVYGTQFKGKRKGAMVELWQVGMVVYRVIVENRNPTVTFIAMTQGKILKQARKINAGDYSTNP